MLYRIKQAIYNYLLKDSTHHTPSSDKTALVSPYLNNFIVSNKIIMLVDMVLEVHKIDNSIAFGGCTPDPLF